MARTKKTETAVSDTTVGKIAGAAAENTAAEPILPEVEPIKRIYVGATIGNIKTNTIFTGDIPKALDVEFVRDLCIPLDCLAEFRRRLGVTSSREAFLYRISADYAKNIKQ